MRRWWAVVLTAALAVSAACGTRVPENERAARRAAALEGPGSVEAADGGAPLPGYGEAGVDAPSGAGAESVGPFRSTVPGASGPAGRGTGGGLPAGAAGPASSPVGSGPSGAAPRTTGTSDPGVTDTEIRIGASAPLSGLAGFAGEEALGAVDSYFQTINAQGGVGGRKLRLIAYDDRLDSSQILANVRRLYERDKVVAIFPPFGDPVLDYATRNRIPTVVLGITPKSFSSRYPTVFPMFGNVLLYAEFYVTILKSAGVFKPGMRVALLYETQIFDSSRYLPFLKQTWESAGAKVVSADPFNLSDGDCTSLVLKMRQLQIDYWDFHGLGWLLCAPAAARQQYRPTLGWGGWPTSAAGLASQVGPWVEGMWGGSQGDQPDGKPRTKTAANAEYVDAISTYHPRLNTVGHLESPVTIGYWVGAKLLVAAIRPQGEIVTKAGINNWLATFENFDSGITPPIVSMAPNCKIGSEIFWAGRWHWDAEKREAVRTPETGYVGIPPEQKTKFGGKCFLTKLADSFEK